MTYNCYAGKGSEDIGSGVCRSIIDHNDRQPELEALLDNPPYLCPMVVNRDDNGTSTRYLHKMRASESMVLRSAATDHYIEILIVHVKRELRKATLCSRLQRFSKAITQIFFIFDLFRIGVIVP